MANTPLIALLQIEALYYPPGYVEPAAPDMRLVASDEYWNHEYIPKDRDRESVSWRISDAVDEYYPMSFSEITDVDWEDEDEFVYREVLKRVPTHPDLEIIEGRIVERHTGKYRPVETAKYPLFIRFPVIARAVFSVDSYNSEVDCSYWFEGVPDLTHLEDLIPKEKKEKQ